jgi:NADPH2:quinone reductase
MKKIVVRRPGGPEALEIVECADPVVGEGQVLVDIRAVGLNWSEVMIRSGQWPVELGAGFTLGAEAAGVVEKVGPEVFQIQPGQKVALFDINSYWFPEQGTYAEKIVVEADKILPVPEDWDFATAASVPMAMLTAYDAMVFHSPLPEEGVVVVTAATGAVGIAAIQIAKRSGLRVIGTSRDKTKSSLISGLGAEAVIEFDPQRLKEKISALVGEVGVDYVFDPINGETASRLLEIMAKDGAYVYYGTLGGNQFTVPPNCLFHQVRIDGYVVLMNMDDGALLQEVWDEILPLLETREVQIPVARTFPWEKAAEAHRAMESHRHFGKLVLVRE